MHKWRLETDVLLCIVLTELCQTQAEETDVSMSELARVVGGERALIGECGDLLSKTYKSQVCLAQNSALNCNICSSL